VLDPVHSTVRLRTRSVWGLVEVRGEFTRLSGAGVISAAGEVSGTFTVVAASIDTKNHKRDSHLRSADFLDSDRYPQIVCSVERLSWAGEGATLDATLRARDQTRALTLPVVVSAFGDDVVQLDAAAVIDRADFGITRNPLGMASRKNAIAVTAVFNRL
jgi:polyisoprenoid-binding protein YceI